MTRAILSWVAILSAVTGCRYHVPPGFEPARHVVFVNEDGRMQEAHDTATVRRTGVPAGRELSDSVAVTEVGALMTRIRESGRDTVTLFLHGGLVMHARARATAGALGDSLMKDGHFPVFVAWEAGWFPTLADHLKSVRQGQEWTPIAGWLSAPFIVTADLGRAVARAPLGMLQQAADYCATWRGVFSDSVRRVRGDHSCGSFSGETRARRRSIRQTLTRTETEAVDSLRITLGNYHSDPARNVGRTLSAWITAIPKAFVTGPLMDGFGTGTYENMRRRTQTMFRQSDEMSTWAAVSGYRRPNGVVSVLLDSLERLVGEGCETGGPCKRHLNIAAHSMGSIVAARILRVRPGLRVRNLWFLAAAATVNDIEQSVVPYLMAHPETRFYNGMLHPRIEVSEAQWLALDLVPRGTLLEYIDDHLTSPETPLDRTAGKWDNMAAMEYIFPPEVRSRVLLKGFGFHDPRDQGNKFLYQGLTGHGYFDKPSFAFWRAATWCVYRASGCVVD